jgi:hypothetical protein
MVQVELPGERLLNMKEVLIIASGEHKGKAGLFLAFAFFASLLVLLSPTRTR